MFTIYSDSSSDSTMVSNLFIDEYMKSANDAQIKIYLYLLRVMSAHRPTSVSDMADQFNHTEKDVIRSLRYWEQKGLLNLKFSGSDSAGQEDLVSVCLCRPDQAGASARAGFSALSGTRQVPAALPSERAGHMLSFRASADSLTDAAGAEGSALRMTSGGAVSFADTTVFTAAGRTDVSPGAGDSFQAGIPAPENPGPAPLPQQTQPTGAEVLEAFQKDAGRAQLLFVIEQYIGKPLSLNEIGVIYDISERLHFSDDLVDYLIQYCVDRGKKDFRYIRGVADKWAAEGIMTPAQAESLQSVPEGVRGGKKNKAGRKSGSASGNAKARAGRSENAPADRDGSDSGLSSSRAVSGTDSSSGARTGRGRRSSNSFNQFEQNSYDFDALEEELLNSPG